jgi:hypothetical protein
MYGEYEEQQEMDNNAQAEYEYNASMAAQAEAEAQEMQAYEDYLTDLLETKRYTLFAAHVAEDWLTSSEFVNSGKSALEFIREMKDRFSNVVTVMQDF